MYVGLPWQRLGRDREGIDCWGLARLVLGEQRGIWLPPYDTVDPDDGACTASAIAAGRQEETWLPVPSGGQRLFDIAVMRAPIRVAGKLVSRPVHVGIFFATPQTILHVQEGGSSVLQPLSDLLHRVDQIYRHKDLA